MRKKKYLLRLLRILLCIVLILCILPVISCIVYLTSPNVYTQSYYAALPLKFDRLTETKGSRIVMIGGSSAAFGLDSQLIEQETGIPCVNFGLYAAFGLKPMLDLSKSAVHKGDIIIIAPEVTSQMYSEYCGYDYLLQACETKPSMLLRLGTSYIPGLMSKLPAYIKESTALKQKGGASNTGVYALSSFDAYGDIVYDRHENIMDKAYSPDNLPEIDSKIITQSFLDMINDYTAYALSKGASVYFSFSPINFLSVQAVETADFDTFTQCLANGLNCELLCPLSDRILDAGYFYDSNFHLNETGVKCYSLLLANDILRITGNMRKTQNSIPVAPHLSNDNIVLSSGVFEGYAFDVTAKGVTITGLDSSGMQLDSLNVPAQIEGKPVIAIAEHAFADSKAHRITLPDSICSLAGSLFENASELQVVELYATDLPEVGNSLMQGAPDSTKIRVPASIYGRYTTDYFWGAYADRLEAME